MRALPLILGCVALFLGAAWWFTAAPQPEEARERVVLEPEPTEFATDEPPATELDDPDAPLRAGEVVDAGDDVRLALVEQTKPVVADAVDRSKPAAPLEFVVIDERSQAPLPRYFVWFVDAAGRKLQVLTDERGEAKTEPLALGDVTVVPSDHATRLNRREQFKIVHVENRSRPLVVSVVSGPTYRLVFAPDPGPDPNAIQARITLDNEEGNSGTTNFERVRAAEPYRREGEPLWIRFPALDETLTRGRRIEARSLDGMWTGSANVTVAVGEVIEPVRIQLDKRGVLTGKVTSAGSPVEGAVVTVRAAGGKDKNYSQTARTKRGGEYRIEFLRPMDLSIRVASIRHEPTSRDLTVRGGETHVQDFELNALPSVDRIRGTVVSETGTYQRDVDVTLMRSGNEGGDAPRLRAGIEWKLVDGRYVGEFDFGHVPKGKYRVDFARVDWFEWTPRRVVVEAPKEDIVVRVADGALTADFAFELHDSDNGLKLNRAHIVLETIDGERQQWLDSGDVVLWGYPEDKRLRWRLDKTGYPSQIGDVKSFEVTTLVDGRRRRTAEINVQPGWSEVVRVLQTKEDKPIANVAVSLDGREAGKTDKNGQLRVSAREKPKSLTVAAEGWRMEGGVDLRQPSQRNFRRFIDVRMRPAKKK